MTPLRRAAILCSPKARCQATRGSIKQNLEETRTPMPGGLTDAIARHRACIVVEVELGKKKLPPQWGQ